MQLVVFLKYRFGFQEFDDIDCALTDLEMLDFKNTTLDKSVWYEASSLKFSNCRIKLVINGSLHFRSLY